MSKIDLDFFEKIVIQQVLKKDNTYLASCVDHLEKELFKNKDIGAIIGTIKEFYLERDAIPTFTELKTRLNSPEMKAHLEKVVKEIKDLDKDRDEDELIANTEYFLKQRKTDLLLEKAVDEKINDKEVNLDEFQKESEKISNICLVDDLGLDYFEDNEKVVQYLLEKDNLISTGLKVVDEAFSGGLHKEGRSIYGIAGSTNVGKSILVGNIITNVIKQGYNVVLITLEMSEKRYAKRISGMLTGIALAELTEKIDNYKEYIQDFISDNKARLLIKEFPTKGVSPKQMKAFIQMVERKKGFSPNLIGIDYPALAKCSRTGIAKYEEIQNITQECRGMSYAFECPLIAPAQLNRGSHKAQKPGLDTVSGSWDSLSDYDNFSILSQTEEEREMNKIQIRGGKARDGAQNGGGYLSIDYNTLRFFEEGMVEKKSEAVKQMENLTEHLDFSELFAEN